MAVNDEEAEEIIREAYATVEQVEPVFHKRTGQIPVFIDPENGEAIVPKIREVRCPCKRKMKIYLVQSFPPVWAGKCPTCKSDHFRGATEEIQNMPRWKRRKFVKQAKKLRKGKI